MVKWHLLGLFIIATLFAIEKVVLLTLQEVVGPGTQKKQGMRFSTNCKTDLSKPCGMFFSKNCFFSRSHVVGLVVEE